MNLCPKLDLNLYVKIQLAYINYAIRLKNKDLKEDLKTLKIWKVIETERKQKV